jgi:hypothetical protein
MQTNPLQCTSRPERGTVLAVLVMWMLSLMLSQGAEVSISSGPERVALIELFTSEGCSSCPPAEAWFGKLESDPRLWSQFVPVAFHVDYWDRLGWRDPFAKREFTERQRHYASKWSAPSVYTPGFVWNGAEWKGWFRGEALPGVEAAAAGRLSLRAENRRQWRVAFVPDGSTVKPAFVHVALLGSGLSSDVKAGENRGRRLNHAFITLALADDKLARSNDTFAAALTLPETTVPDTARQAVASWITASDGVTVVQAVGGWLPAADAPSK